MPKLVDKNQKMKMIQAAALKVISQKGYANTKMVDIAKEAEIGKGTIYEYFRSKDEIFSTAFISIFNVMNRDMERRLRLAEDPVQKLQSIIEATLEFVTGDHKVFAGVMMDVWAEGVRHKDDRILKIIDVQKIYQQFRETMAAILQEGIEIGIFRPVNTFMMASLMIGAMDGLMLQLIMDDTIFKKEEAIAVFMEGFVKGLKK